jgi:hypothetical protein
VGRTPPSVPAGLTVNEQILTVLRERGPMSMGKVAIAVGKNVGGVRQRLLLMEAIGKVERFDNEHGSQWFVPESSPEEDGQTRT